MKMLELIPAIGLYHTLLMMGYSPYQAEKILKDRA